MIFDLFPFSYVLFSGREMIFSKRIIDLDFNAMIQKRIQAMLHGSIGIIDPDQNEEQTLQEPINEHKDILLAA